MPDRREQKSLNGCREYAQEIIRQASIIIDTIKKIENENTRYTFEKINIKHAVERIPKCVIALNKHFQSFLKWPMV